MKDIALILSPFVAVLIAAATIWFNAYDRKRHYALEREKLALEREKLAKEMAKTILAGSRSLEKRIDLYNEMFDYISAIAHYSRTALTRLTTNGDVRWHSARVSESLNALVAKARSGQIFTTKFRHKAITNDFALKVAQQSDEVEDFLSEQADGSRDAVINRLTQIISACDVLKDTLRDDLEIYVRGLANVSIQQIEEA